METQKPQLDPGQKIFSWESYNYHPYQRGIVWMVVFCSLFFGCSLWAIMTDPQWGWLTAFTFLITAASYFFAHRNGNEKHEISFFEQGFYIDQKQFFSWQDFKGYWFVYDESVTVLNLATEKNNRKISLQMGEISLREFREVFEKIELPELTEQKESLVDLWIRALKL
jgi:hypothetical protein